MKQPANSQTRSDDLAIEMSESAGISRLRGVITAPFLFLIAAYQRVLSPIIHAAAGPAFGCRFHPTCSHYAAEALRTHGLARGFVLAVWRLLRCTPLSAGGFDPVPTRTTASGALIPATNRMRCERVV